MLSPAPCSATAPKSSARAASGTRTLFPAALRPDDKSCMGALDRKHQRGTPRQADQLSRTGQAHRCRIPARCAPGRRDHRRHTWSAREIFAAW